MSAPVHNETPAMRHPATMQRLASPFLPILVLALVLAGWFLFQSLQLLRERDAMQAAIANQEKQMQESKKLRDSLDAIAKGTASLADAGNPNAKLIVDELKKRGITISPNTAPAK